MMNIRNSMSVRVMLIVFGILLAVFTAITLVTTFSLRKTIWTRNLEEADVMANLILNGIRYPMLKGEQDIIQRQFDNYADSKGIDAISLLDHLGIVRRSTDRSILGQMSMADELEKAISGDLVEKIESKKFGRKRVFSRMVPIMNELNCYPCHGSQRKVLGVLRVTLDIQSAFDEIMAMRKQTVLFSFLGMAVLVFLVNMYLFRSVVFPISKLEQAMQKVAGGDLKQQVAETRGDEIGVLTKIFNKMTSDLSELVEKEKALVSAEQDKTEKLASVNADLIQEIKERRKTEEKLNTAYRQFSDIIEFLPDATFVIDRDRKVIAWNKALEELSGVQKRDIIGKGDRAYSVPFYGTARLALVDLVFEPDREIEAQYGSFERRGDRLYMEVYSRHLREGKGAYLVAVASPLYDSSGSLVGAIESVRDVTMHKINEERILRAAQEWRITFDSIRDLITIIDKDCVILRCNMAFANAFNTSPEAIIGKKSCDFYPVMVNDPAKNSFVSNVFEHGKSETFEISLPNTNFWYEITTSPIFDMAGKVTGAVQIAKDISARKEIEKKERLAQLGKLVADMAHEVNNPLMIISGRAQLSLMEDIRDPEIKGNLQIIMDECQRGKDIIQRLLKFSRRGKNEMSDLDVNKVLESVVGIIEHQFSLSGVEIKKNYGQSLPNIWADERQIQEVFMNLLSNAREAMPRGGRIEITTELSDGNLRIIFRDNGTGMSPDVLERVCEPFFTTKEKGTGLGLSVCYGIIKGHGGELTFESDPVNGTAAIINLPVTGKGDDK